MVSWLQVWTLDRTPGLNSALPLCSSVASDKSRALCTPALFSKMGGTGTHTLGLRMHAECLEPGTC